MLLGLGSLRGLMSFLVNNGVVGMLLTRAKFLVWVAVLIVFGVLGAFTDENGKFRNYGDIVSCPPNSSCGC